MPSPSLRKSPRRSGPKSPARSSLEKFTDSNNDNSTANNNNNPTIFRDIVDSIEEQQQQQQQQQQNTHTIGKRTGITIPPRGDPESNIPIDQTNGFESIDAFWDAAKSPVPSAVGLGLAASGGKKEGKKGGKRAGDLKKEVREERQRAREEWEEEQERNVGKGPELLNYSARKYSDDDDDGDDDDDDEKQQQYQRTPTVPGWSNRLLHKAMGIDNATPHAYGESTTFSPANTILSRVSTAPPSAAASIATHQSLATNNSNKTNASEASTRHAMRQSQQQVQLDNLIHNSSSSVEYSPGNNDENDENDVNNDGGEKGMDPPEEMEDSSNGNVHNRGGIDPEEKDFVLEPEDTSTGEMVSQASIMSQSQGGAVSERTTPSKALDESLEEVVGTYDNEYDDDDNDNDNNDDDDALGGGMQFATQDGMEDDTNFDTGGAGDDYDNNNDMEEEEEDAITQESSKRSRKSDNHDDNNHAPRNKKQPKQKQKAPVTPTSSIRKKGSKKKNTTQRVNWSTPTGHATGIPTANRDYEAVPVSDFKEEYSPGREPRTPGGTSIRRSKRARFKPLQFWKNEKLIYEAQHEDGLLGEAMGDMPVVAGVMQALPTPYKEKKVRVREEKAAKQQSKKKKDEDSEEDERGSSRSTPFDPSKLLKKYHVHNGESGSVWSETKEDTMDAKIVSRLESRSFSKLPLSTNRKKSESKVVGFASQAFHVLTDNDDLFPGYIAGNVVLPPRGIKDAEGVGLCSQVFNVGDCQPNSLEFALADPSSQDGEFDASTAQRFLLSKGDMFQIPPGNVYRIENHSKTDKASLFWTIIKCTSRAEQDSEEE